MSDRLEGWFAVDRKSISHPFFKRSERSEYEAWIWLIAHAAWKETHHWVNGKRHDVKRGEMFTTLRELQSAWMWSSDKKVRGFLKRLSDERMIDAETSHGKTQVTICNYSLYQDIGRKKDAEMSEKSPSKGQAKDAIKEQTKQINKSSSLHSEDITALQKPDNSKIEINQAFEAYNLAAQENDWAVCQKISKARTSQMKARLKDCGGIDGFMACLEKCKASDFLQGRVGGSNGAFQLGIDFILRDSSFTKIMEGNYDNRKQPEKQKSISSASMFFEAARQAGGLSQ
jgi:hypothetical protein